MVSATNRRYTAHRVSSAACAGRQESSSALIKTNRSSRSYRRHTNLVWFREDAGLEDILTLNATDFLDRRLQTTIHRRGYADTPMEARQLVTHGMVRVDGRRIDVPGYMLTQEEESQIEVSEPEETEEEVEETQE
nr:MAG: ribosomal protein S4-related protein [Candidatus Nanosalinarum sp. J07AB56]